MTPFVTKNPDVIRMPKKRTRRIQAKIAYMTPEQIERFLDAAKQHGQREYTMFLLGFNHGLRISEICELTLDDIDLKNGQIRCRRKKGSLHTTQTLVRFKGAPLFDEVKALRDWLAVRPADHGNYVFNSQKATHLDRITGYKLFRKIAEKAGLPESLRHPHCMKHSTAMAMVNKGVDAFLIRQYLGHKSFQSTLAYVNPSDKQASDAAVQAFAGTFA
jgi:type 1 fimbriae regulatory protein FimB